MTSTLLILHFLAFSVGIGGTFANLVITRRATRSDASTRPALAAAGRQIGLAATLGLAVLWVTGPALVARLHGSWAALPDPFLGKMVFVVVLTICSVLINLSVIAARRTGSPPPPRRMAFLGTLALVSAVLALILAVRAFRQ